jgi:hypothetical protein
VRGCGIEAREQCGFVGLREARVCNDTRAPGRDECRFGCAISRLCCGRARKFLSRVDDRSRRAGQGFVICFGVKLSVILLILLLEIAQAAMNPAIE